MAYDKKNTTGSVIANWFFELAKADRNMQAMQMIFEDGSEILRFEKFCQYNQFFLSAYSAPCTVQFANMQKKIMEKRF